MNSCRRVLIPRKTTVCRKYFGHDCRLRGIKNSEKLAREDLIISFLRSESSALENNFNNNTDDDDTYNGKTKGKISDIRMMLSRLGNIVTNNNRKKVRKKLYAREKKEILSDLVELVRTLDKKEYKHRLLQNKRHRKFIP